jgi:putative ABC transport system permease protein
MTVDPELRQMLQDAARSRAHRSWIVRLWHGAAERINVLTSRRRARTPKPKGPIMLTDDLRHAARRITSKPATALACVGMLALAIGVTSAMFTVADHMLIRPAPFKKVERIKSIYLGKSVKESRIYLPIDIARSLRQAPGFEATSFFVPDPTFVDSAEGLLNPGAFRISVGAFELLGVAPIMGRTFAPGEGRAGNDDGVIISERLWRSGFGADPEIIGRRINGNGKPMTVIGVMPASLRFPSDGAKVWRPIDLDAPPPAFAAAAGMVFARLKERIGIDDAAKTAADVSMPASKTPEKHGIVIRGLRDGYLDSYSKTAIKVLLAGVGLVFLVLCANATNLILARTTSRRQEFGVCSAIGASRMRLVRQVFLENALIGAGALIVGLVAAWVLVALARSYLPEAFLLRTLNPIDLDARAFGVAAFLAVFATLVAGLPPAWIGTGVNASDSMRLESRGSSESRLSRAWTRGLLVGEVALASALLVGAGVLLTSFIKLTTLDSGLDAKGVTTMYVTLPEFAFKDRPARAAYTEDLQRNVRSLPGVTAVTLSFGLPPDGGAFSWGHIVADGVPRITDREQEVFWSQVTGDFFSVYGIALKEGRTFAVDDAETNVIVGEGLAAMLWPGQSPIGHTFNFEGSKQVLTVIGMAKEVRSPLMDPRDDLPEFYRPLKSAGGSQVMLGLRCTGDCPSEAVLRERVRTVNSQAVVHEIKTVEAAYLEQFAKPRAAAGLAVAFAVTSVIAAAGGLFSILTYAVNRRRREFGVRSAMGARPDQLRALILRDGLMIAGIGLAIGGLLTFALNKTLISLSFGITAAHPAVWSSVAAIVCVVTVLAAWRPAANAMRSDPIALLRDN